MPQEISKFKTEDSSKMLLVISLGTINNGWAKNKLPLEENQDELKNCQL